MSLNNIRLPEAAIAALYKDVLVLPEATVHEPQKITEKPLADADSYAFLGQNLKKIVLLQSSPGLAFLPEHHLHFLSKMLEACKMTLADTAIINQHSKPVEIAALKSQLNPQTIILFGLEPTEIRLPFNIPPFKIQEYDQCRYLCAPELNILNQDTEEGKLLKSKLWVCLRKLFGI